MRLEPFPKPRGLLGAAPVPVLVLGLLLEAGCAKPGPRTEPGPRSLPPVTIKVTPPAPPVPAVRHGAPRFARLQRFASAADFDAYLERLREARKPRLSPDAHGVLGLLGPAGSDSEGALGGLIGDQIGAGYGMGGLGVVGTGRGGGGLGSITNNQVQGVDEGDIVKATGDYLIILRRGRLFSVRRQAGPWRATLRPTGRCDAYPRGKSRGTWYDELLVHGRRIVVIGYSYRERATEIGLFRLGRHGGITHRATYFLRSNDYYSSRNYASRLIGDRLLFYMPYNLALPDKGPPELPAIASWDVQRRRARPWRPILGRVDVYQPVQPTLYPTLHTVVECELQSAPLRCSARAVIGPHSRSFYVSREAVYVWVGSGAGWDRAANRQRRNRSYVYRLPLDAQTEVGAIRAQGQPVDQFSFRESADGHLNVLLAATGGGDWMFNPEDDRGKLALLRLPLWMFSAAPLAAPASAYTALPRSRPGMPLHNRFVGDWLLWGSGAGWWGRPASGGTLYATHLARPQRIQRLALDHGVERIEAMGRNAVAVGNGRQDLFFTAVALGQRARVSNTWVRHHAAQGETRSHGFFFRPTSIHGAGLLGLPVRQGRPGRHLWHGSAEVLFLRVSDQLRFAPLGALGARGKRLNDACKVSCVDWYGNARPIFLGDRILALMGYELVEGALDGDGLHELRRVRFLHPR